MSRHIALLRGINVSGQKKVPMKDLKLAMEKAGFQDVQTYIQSGNIIFEDTEKRKAVLEERIERLLDQTFGFDVKVIVRSPSNLTKVIRNNPFLKTRNLDESKLYITFLKTKPDQKQVRELEGLSSDDEQFHFIGTEIYFYFPNGYGNAKLNNNFFERKLKLSATTRNWKTVNVLSKIGE